MAASVKDILGKNIAGLNNILCNFLPGFCDLIEYSK